MLIILFSVQVSKAQINAVTDTGDEVLLYDDGTWSYTNEDLLSDDTAAISLNEKKFTKDEDASFLVKSKNVDIGVWINPKKWSFTKKGDNEDAEFQFRKKGEDLYALLISEKMEISIETLRDLALENGRSFAPDLKIIEEEYRMVNGVKVLMMEMVGTGQGIKFVYQGYYYSNSSGSIQLTTFTGKSLYDEYKEDMHQFLNGFVEL